jgi:hypothetical protein
MCGVTATVAGWKLRGLKREIDSNGLGKNLSETDIWNYMDGKIIPAKLVANSTVLSFRCLSKCL